MTQNHSIAITVGLEPQDLHTSVVSPASIIGGTEGDFTTHRTDVHLELSNQSQYCYSNLKLTVSYYDQNDSYLDFEDTELADIDHQQSRAQTLTLEAPEKATSATIDITGDKQTLLKRHWKWISTVAVVIWGLIILARRLGPSFTQ